MHDDTTRTSFGNFFRNRYLQIKYFNNYIQFEKNTMTMFPIRLTIYHK